MISPNWAKLQAKKQSSANPTRKRKPKTQEPSEPQKAEGQPELTSIVALDCEMVGVGLDGVRSILARCSIVNIRGEILLDCYVKPSERVVDFRTKISGILPQHILGPHAIEFADAQSKVKEIIDKRTIVGHALSNDFKCLQLPFPSSVRDTAVFFARKNGGKLASLKHLCQTELALSVQSAHHSSVEDARAALAIYKKHRQEWERSVTLKTKTKKKQKLPQKKPRAPPPKVDEVDEDSESPS